MIHDKIKVTLKAPQSEGGRYTIDKITGSVVLRKATHGMAADLRVGSLLTEDTAEQLARCSKNLEVTVIK